MQSTHEMRGARARRLAREADERTAEAEVRESLTLGRLRAAEERAEKAERSLGLCRDELHGATVAGQRMAEVLAETDTVAAHLAEMVRESLTAPEAPLAEVVPEAPAAVSEAE